MSKRKLPTWIRVLGAASLLTVSSLSHAAITPFSDDFESYGAAGVPSQPDFFSPGGWLGFSDNCGFPGGYSFLPSTSGPQIAALGYNGSDNQYVNIYANYDNTVCQTGGGPNAQEEIFVYQQQSFTGADTASGATWMFRFNYRQADIPPDGNAEVDAFIRVFDPIFNILFEARLDPDVNTFEAGDWRTGVLTVELDPAWVSGNIQFGFTNLVDNFDDSGIFYDEVTWQEVIPAQVDIQGGFGGSGEQVHPHHDGRFLTLGALPDDIVPVYVLGSSTAAGDPVDLDTNLIDFATLRFGPGDGPATSTPPAQYGIDEDGDGIQDARFNFFMSDANFECTEQTADLVGNLTTGDTFVGTDGFISNCNAQCHN